ncbi:MAG: YdcF family protein [Spirochaetes bacterium]|nr:YdcF family protein [Spirochaetota bacterium]
MKKRAAAAIFVPLLLTLPILYIAIGIMSYSSRAPLRRADAAIVLGAAVWRDQPSPVFKERINHAIGLYKRGMVKKIIFTGARDSRNEAPASEVARRYAMARRVPSRDILVETQSRTTLENLRYASRLGGAHRLKSYLIVSDPLHMKRAMLMAGNLHLSAYQAPTPTTRYRGWGSKMQFLSREIYFYVGDYMGRLLLPGD